jgi:molybdopterin/thiamine biosynthesis adenylyltransferase
MRIPGWNQSKLKRARVFIAGMGALGNEVAKNLALAGVGSLLVLDFDCVEYTNLNRTVLFTDDDVGSPKVKAAAKSIHRLNPSTKVTTFNQTLQELKERSPTVVQSADLLVGCLDNREARFILNHTSVGHRIPYVDGGMLNAMGSVRVSVPPYTPCLECGIPQSTYAQIGQRYRCEELVFDDLTLKQMAVRHPTISTVTSITAAIQSHEALKILLGLELFRSRGIWPEGTGKPIENEIQYDSKTNSFLTQSVHRDIECYVCGTRGALDPVRSIMLRVASGDRIRDLLAKASSLLRNKRVSLVRGLKPFPDRTAATSGIRNLLQRVNHLSRLFAKSTLNRPEAQEGYRILHTFLESNDARSAQDSLRQGIPFRPDDSKAFVNMMRDAVESTASKTSLTDPEYSGIIAEIRESSAHTLELLGDDLTVREWGLRDKDILCAIRGQNRLRDAAVEIALEPPSI